MLAQVHVKMEKIRVARGDEADVPEAEVVCASMDRWRWVTQLLNYISYKKSKKIN